jgi:glycosyltransferase involved in cell wall biosynthesis
MELPRPKERGVAEYELLCVPQSEATPKISIITTVYDRVNCLQSCLHSVAALAFTNYEHIVVADAPPPQILAQLIALCTTPDIIRPPLLLTLKCRTNNWGISPAAVGLMRARGKYVCFLSDDNGYHPCHFDPLVEALESDPTLGFVYSSCLYAGKWVLNVAPPARGAVDLGQPLFRRDLFVRYLGGTIPFREFGWDWRMIATFMSHGVRWQHIDRATFVFRLASYPELCTSALRCLIACVE